MAAKPGQELIIPQRTSPAEWGPGGSLWRYHPGAKEDSHGAFIEPCINALYIPQIRPLVGDNFLEIVAESSLFRFEIFLHEFSHFFFSTTSLGSFLRNSRYAVYLVLSSLSEGRILRLPSWRIQGDEDLSKLMKNLLSFIPSLNEKAKLVDEAIATAITIANLRFLVSVGRTKQTVYEKVEAGIRDTTKHYSGVKVWILTERLSSAPWFKTTDVSTYVRTVMLLHALGSYAFDLGNDTLRKLWQAGSIRADEEPAYRLEQILKHYAGVATGTLDRAVTLFLQGVSMFKQRYSRRQGAGDAPNPFHEVAMLLGLAVDRVYLAHPVGRAIDFLISGHSATKHSEMILELVDKRRRSLCPAISGCSVVLPLVAKDHGAIRCQYMTRLPIGRMIARFVSGEFDGEGIGSTEGPAPYSVFGPMTVMPVSDEVMLLWNLESILEQLLETNHLHCLDATECTISNKCPGKGLLATVHEHTRTDTGQRLPAVRCLS